MVMHFAVVFWGEKYRRFFLDYCLPSLMAPGNIPGLGKNHTSRFLIATTIEDWEALQSEAIIEFAKQYVEIELLTIEAPIGDFSPGERMMAMSRGHKLISMRFYEYQEKGVIVYPDMILADGTVTQLVSLSKEGWQLVLCMSIRYATMGLIEKLSETQRFKTGHALTLSPRELVELTFEHLHPEFLRSDFDGKLKDSGACTFFWRVPSSDDLLFHAASWAPLLIDYGALELHDSDVFDKDTLDGDYIANNFRDYEKIYVIQDSDEIFVTGYTPGENLSQPFENDEAYEPIFLGRARKIVNAHKFMVGSGQLDKFKHKYFELPIRIRTTKRASEKAWKKTEERAIKMVSRILNGEKTAFEEFLERNTWTQWRNKFLWLGSVYAYKVKPALCGDVKAIKHLWCRIIFGKRN